MKRMTAGSWLLAACALVLVALLIGERTVARAQRPGADLEGTIAYIHGGDEIRFIRPDGGGDHLVWTVPSPAYSTILGLAWHPRGEQLAIASDHEAVCSYYDSDVYVLDADGGNPRKLTNPPACADLAGFRKGRVTLKLENGIADFNQYLLYVEGAPSARLVTVQPGTRVAVTIDNVADLGPGVPQRVVAANGSYRWFDPVVAVDVRAGETVAIKTALAVHPSPASPLGALSPSWSADGESVGYLLGLAGGLGPPHEIPADPQGGGVGQWLLDDDVLVGATWLSRSPVADDFLYASTDGIYRATRGERNAGRRLVATDALILGFDWLPDGSGFVYAEMGDYFQHSNIYRYDFAAGRGTPLTSFESEYAGGPSVSPDGRYVVFEHATTLDQSVLPDLRVMALDGSEAWPLGVSGNLPDWGPVTVAEPAFFGSRKRPETGGVEEYLAEHGYEVLGFGQAETTAKESQNLTYAWVAMPMVADTPADDRHIAQVTEGFDALLSAYATVDLLSVELLYSDEISLVYTGGRAEWADVRQGRLTWARFWRLAHVGIFDRERGRFLTAREQKNFVDKHFGGQVYWDKQFAP